MVQVEITTTVITAEYGAMATGTILRCSKEFADHLVNHAYAAKYVQAPAEKKVEAPAEKPAIKAKTK